MLRTASEKYDQWVSNELPFNSPEVLNAMEIYGQFHAMMIMLRVGRLLWPQHSLAMHQKVCLRHLHNA